MDRYTSFNWVTGQNETPPENDGFEEWEMGWNDCMEDGYNSNPFDKGTKKHADYEAGYKAAEEE